MPNRTILSISLIFLVALLVSTMACQRSDSKKGFTEREVLEAEQTLRNLNPAGYRIILPEIKNRRIVGSKTNESLPVAKVRRLASLGNITFIDKSRLPALTKRLHAPGSTQVVPRHVAGQILSVTFSTAFNLVSWWC